MNVPTVDGPTVRQEPLRIPTLSIDAGPEAFGAGIARGLGVVANNLDEIATDKLRTAVNADVADVGGAAQRATNDVWIAAKSKLMREAEGSAKVALDAHKKIYAEAEAAAKSPHAKSVIHALGIQSANQLAGQTMSHEAEQKQAYDDWMVVEFSKTQRGAAALDAKNWVAADIAMANGGAAIRAHLHGEDVDNQVAIFESSVNAARLQALIDARDNSGFLEIWDEVKDSLTAADKGHFSPTAANVTDLQQVVTEADKWYTKFPASEEKALLAVKDGGYTPSVRVDLESRLRTMYGTAATDKQRVDNADADRLHALWNDGGENFSLVPRDLYARVNATNPALITSLMQSTERGSRGERVTRSDSDIYTMLAYLTKAERLDPQNEPSIYINKLTTDAFQHFVQLKADAVAERDGFDKVSQKPTYGAGEISKLIKDSFSPIYNPDSKGFAKRFHAFDGLVRSRIEHFQANNHNQLPSFAELEGYVAWALTKGVRVDAGLFGTDLKGFRYESLTAPGGEVFDPYDKTKSTEDPLDVVNYVPMEDAARIAAMIRARGGTPSSELILTTYRIEQASKPKATP